MTQPVLDFWFDFASTYSYPACMRIGSLAQAGGIRLRYRVFLLGPVFNAQGWNTSPFNIYELKGRYMWRDLERLCAQLSLPFTRPEPFPQNSLLAARTAVACAGESWHGDLCRAIFHAQFGEGRRIDDAATLTDILRQLGADASQVLAKAASDPVKAALRAETEIAAQHGIFGAPSFVTPDGELFWGNDRLDAALAWIAAHPDANPSER